MRSPRVLAQTFTAIINIYAVHRGEFSNAVQRKRRTKRVDISNEYLATLTFKERVKWWWDRQREADNIGSVSAMPAPPRSGAHPLPSPPLPRGHHCP